MLDQEINMKNFNESVSFYHKNHAYFTDKGDEGPHSEYFTDVNTRSPAAAAPVNPLTENDEASVHTPDGERPADLLEGLSTRLRKPSNYSDTK